MLAVAVCPLLKADSLTPQGTMTMSQREQGAAQVSIVGIGHLYVVYEGDVCQMSTKIILMVLNLMGTP